MAATSGKIDQLWYTWTRHGLTDHEGEQVRAGSPGLLDPSSAATAAAKKVCYNTRLRRSFGWADHNGKRVVFHKVAAGLDGRGRTGNFFAHVIVGDPETLPPMLLAGLEQSSFWVTRDVEAPEVELADVAAADLRVTMSPQHAPELVAAFLAQLLHMLDRHGKVAIPSNLQMPGALVGTALGAIPERLAQLSFSSGEPRETVDLFDIVVSDGYLPGFDVFDADVAKELPTYAAARAMLDPDPQCRAEIIAATTEARTIREFVKILVMCLDMRDGNTVNLRDIISIATHNPEALIVMAQGKGAERFAQRLIDRDEGVLTIADYLPQSGRMIAHVADHVAPDPATALPLLSLLEPRSPSLTRKLTLAVVQKAEKAGLIPTLSPETVWTLLRHLDKDGRADTQSSNVLLCGAPQAARAIVEDTRLRTDWRLAAARNHRSHIGPDLLDHLIRTDAPFARAYVRNPLEDLPAQLERIVLTLDAHEGLALLDRLRIDPAEGERARLRCVARLPRDVRTQSLLTYTADLRRLDSGWDPLVLDALADSVIDSRHDLRSRDMRPSPELIKRLHRLPERSESAHTWLRIERDWHGNPASDSDARGAYLRGLYENACTLSGRGRIGAALILLDRTTLLAPDIQWFYWGFDQAAFELAPCLSTPEGLDAILHAVLRHAVGVPGAQGLDWVLEWLAGAWDRRQIHWPEPNTRALAVLEEIARCSTSHQRQTLATRFAGRKRDERKPYDLMVAVDRSLKKRRFQR